MIYVPNEIIQRVLTEVVELFLKPKFIELGMNASGRWLDSLEVRVNVNRGEIWGMDYTYYLQNGRASGNRPPISPLVQWVGYKFGYSGQQAVSTAYAIANKISKEGTEYYPQGTDLLDVLQSKECLDYINRQIGQYLLSEVRIDMIKRIKKTLETI